MATRSVVPRADNEGGIGTALKRWAGGFFNALSSAAHTITGFTVAGFVKNSAAGVLSGGNSIAAGDLPSGIDAAKIGAGAVDNTEFACLNGAASELQAQINGKGDVSSPGGTIGALAKFTAAKVVGDAGAGDLPSGIDAAKIGAGAVDNTEFSYLDGVTSGLQVQVDAKAVKALSNLASVAINESLVSDTNNTDDLGTAAKKWKNIYLAGHVVGGDGTDGLTNLVTNGDLEVWAGGVAVAPTRWALIGAGASVAQEAAIIKLGLYSAKLTRSGTDCRLRQSLDTERGTAYWQGRTITAGVWCLASGASQGYIHLEDNVAGTYSTAHSGGGAWEFLTVTRTFNAAATLVVVSLRLYNTNASVYFDGVIAVEGSSLFAFSDNPIGTPTPLGTAAAVLTANKGPAGCTAVTGWIGINIAGTIRYIPYW